MRLLPSKRAHLYVLERSRVMLRDGRVEYVSDEGREPKGYNVPVANTSFILLGPGSSITTEAVRKLKEEGVCLGFSGSGGTPLLSAQDPFPDFVCPADEYRDPKFLHKWIAIWSDEDRRLKAAKTFFDRRLGLVETLWNKLDYGTPVPPPPAGKSIRGVLNRIQSSRTTSELLGVEGDYAKELYRVLASDFGIDGFKREHSNRKNVKDPVRDPNSLLDHGNYLAYGSASVVLWTLGIPASLSVLHGKTRRGGLVFDLADVVKDAVVMPLAFATAHRAKSEILTETDFRSTCIRLFDDSGVLPVMFEAMNEVIASC